MIKMTFQAYILGYIYWISTYDAKQILWASLFAQYDVDIISFYPTWTVYFELIPLASLTATLRRSGVPMLYLSQIS